MKLTIIGSGYVGLVTGTCFANAGNDVVCMDIDKDKINSMREGNIPIYEPNLDEMFKNNLNSNRIKLSSDIEESVKHAKVIFLCLPTPTLKNGETDISSIISTCKQIAPLIDSYKIIVTKSTVPVGTTLALKKLVHKQAKADFDIVSNPEFLKEGLAINDFLKPDRIIIGSKSDKAIRILEELYSPFVRTGNPIIKMNETSAELSKYASNSFLATKISFINEMANLSEKLGADIESVRIGITSDSRIGRHFLFPGIGYGGSCFIKDIDAIISTAKKNNSNLKILESVKKINQEQYSVIVKKILLYFDNNIENKKISFWGLSFKPNTDDIRESPSIKIIKKLISKNAKVIAFDPKAIEKTKKLLGKKIEYSNNMYDCLEDSNALVVATEWNIFHSCDLERVKTSLKNKVIFDCRNIYSPQDLKNKGFDYFSIGRK